MASKNQVTLTFAGDDAKLARTFDKVGEGAKQVGGDFDDAGAKTDSWKDKFGKFNKVAVGASLAVAAGVGLVVKDAFGLSQELGKLDAKAGAVFEDSLPSVQAWADGAKRALGVTQTEAVGMAASLADLLKPMGFTADAAAAMATDMVDLSGALADWTGGQKSATEVSDILNKALLGEREGLKQLGISISEADVTARLATKGQEGLTGEALAQAKALATQELIMEKSTDAQAAWADGGKAAAEQQNATKVTMGELRETLARGLTPAFEAGTEIVSKFAGWAEKNQGVVKILAGVIVGLAAVVLTVNAAIKVAAAVQAIWNLAMSLNPIGIVIIAIALLVGAIVFLATKTQFFQTIWKGLKVAFTAVTKAIAAAWGWVVGRFTSAFSRIGRLVSALVAAFRGIPGRLRSAFSTLFNIITWPFRTAFNFVSRAWNNTVGRLSWSVPKWVPGIGGNSLSAPRLPTFHQGGVVPGAPGTETLALLQAGERVTPAGRSGDRMVLEVHSGGSRLDDLLVELLSRAVRVRGGNVQVVLGG